MRHCVLHARRLLCVHTLQAVIGASPLEKEREEQLRVMAASFSSFSKELTKFPGLFPAGTFTPPEWEWAFGTMLNK